MMADYASVYLNMSVYLVFNQPLFSIIIKYVYDLFPENSYIFILMEKLLNVIDQSTIKSKNKIKVNTRVFNQRRFIVDIVSFLSLALTIGIFVPLLSIGIVICLSVYVHNTLSKLGEKILEYKEYHNINETNKLINRIEKECCDTTEILYSNLHLFLIPLMGFFYPIFFFDILGGELGYEKSKFLIYFSIVPLILWIIREYYSRFIIKKQVTADVTNILLGKGGNEENLVELRRLSLSTSRNSVVDRNKKIVILDPFNENNNNKDIMNYDDGDDYIDKKEVENEEVINPLNTNNRN